MFSNNTLTCILTCDYNVASKRSVYRTAMTNPLNGFSKKGTKAQKRYVKPG